MILSWVRVFLDNTLQCSSPTEHCCDTPCKLIPKKSNDPQPAEKCTYNITFLWLFFHTCNFLLISWSRIYKHMFHKVLPTTYLCKCWGLLFIWLIFPCILPMFLFYSLDYFWLCCFGWRCRFCPMSEFLFYFGLCFGKMVIVVDYIFCS